MKKTGISLIIFAILTAVIYFGCKLDLSEDNYLDRPDVEVDTDTGTYEIRGKFINSSTKSITIFRQDIQSSTNTPIERVAILFMEGLEDPDNQTFKYVDERVIANGEYRYYLIFENKDGTRNRTKWSEKKLLSTGGASDEDDIAYAVSSAHFVFDEDDLTLTLDDNGGSGSVTAPGNTVITDIDDYDTALVFQAGDRTQVFKLSGTNPLANSIDLKSLLPEYYYNKEVTLLGIVGQKIETNSTNTEKLKCISWTKIAEIDVKNSSGDDCNPFTLELKFGKEKDAFDYSTNCDNEN